MDEDLRQLMERVGAKVVGHPPFAKKYTTESGCTFYLDKVQNKTAYWTYGDIEVESTIQDGRPTIIQKRNIVAKSEGCFLPDDVYREILRMTAGILTKSHS